MALREKHPNAGINHDTRFETRKLRLSTVTAEKKKFLPTPSDDNKENLPPSTFGTKRPVPIYQERKSSDVGNFLTEKWAQDSSQSSSQTLLTLPPEIQRTSRSVERKKIEKNGPRLPVSAQAAPILPPRVLPNGNVEGTVSLGSIYDDEMAVIDDFLATFNSQVHPGCRPVDHPSIGRNRGGSSRAGNQSFHLELDVLGRTRQAAEMLGSHEAEMASRNDNTENNFGSSKTISATKKEQSGGMNFSAALRSNLDSSLLTNQVPVSRSTNVKGKNEQIPDDKASKSGNSTLSIRSLASSKEAGSAEYAELLLRQMLCDYHEGLADSPPDGGCFNSVVHAYASRGDATKAEAVLALMWHEFYRGNLPPDKRIFTTVMYAWQRSDKKWQAPEACEHLLRQMHQLSDTAVAPECGPDTFTYTCILHCWADSDRPDAAARAESLFRTMLLRYDNGDKNLKPDTICYSNLINVFVNCGEKYQDAERILWEMVDTYLSGLDSAEPTVRSFNTLLAMWSKSNAREAPERVQMILQRWRDLNQQGTIGVTPDEYSYALLLKAWTKAKRVDSIQNLLEAFDWIKGLHEVGEECACPDVIKYTTVIGALNKAGQVDRAFILLGELINKYNEFKEERYKPDARCFHIVLTAFSRTKGNVSAGKKSESLLRRMWTLYKTTSSLDARPTNWTYNTVIFCYQNAGDPKRAERLLREMDNLARSGSIDRGADIRTYKAVVSAWRVSNDMAKNVHIRCLQEEARNRFKQQI
ncbi:hypothetical protein ACA910_020506 [Epithemia clementina (nom. ined.)]